MDVTTERSVYREALEKAKSSVISDFTQDGIFFPPGPNTTPVIAHYSIDMAQQVFYLNNSLQPGLMYFLTPAPD